MKKKQLLLSVLFALILGVFFSTQSRLPALNDKAQMAQRSDVSGLAFDQLVQVSSSAVFVQQWLGASLNWYYTNWKGMSFGLLFAAALLLLLQALPAIPRSRFGWLNSLRGAILGVPLGVCANCSTPVAYSMFKAGSGAEMALATLMSSPTLNILVLSMSFSLLPNDLAVLRLVFIALVILVLLPLISHYMLGRLGQLQLEQLNGISAGEPSCEIDTQAGLAADEGTWLQAILRFASDYFNACLMLVKKTLPLMLLAGVLGGLLIEAVDIPQLVAGFGEAGLWLYCGLLLVAIFALLLPVPIAFDMVFVSALMAAGLNTAFAAVLVFCLPIFSLYPALLLSRILGWRFVIVLSLGISLLASVFAYAWLSYQQTQQQQLATSLEEKFTQLSESVSQQQLEQISRKQCGSIFSDQLEDCVAFSMHEFAVQQQQLLALKDESLCNQHRLVADIQACFAQHRLAFLLKQGDIRQCSSFSDPRYQTQCRLLLTAKSSRAEQALFALKHPQAKPNKVTFNNKPEAEAGVPLAFYPLPPSAGLTLEAADYQVAAKTEGVALFSQAKAVFEPRQLPGAPSLKVFLEPFLYGRGIASGDYDNDGWSDIVLAGEQGIYLYKNQQGRFHRVDLLAQSQGLALDSFVVAFVDLNNDQYLDIFITAYNGRNAILYNDGGDFSRAELVHLAPSSANLALAAGFYDINLDHKPDILLGQWSAGAEKNFTPSVSQNTWLMSRKNEDGYTRQDSQFLAGETLSILFSNLSRTPAAVELVVANDEFVPDFYLDVLLGSDELDKTVTTTRLAIPETSLTTMSLESVDIDNDADLDVLSTDMSFASHPEVDYQGLLEGKKQAAYAQSRAIWAKLKQRDAGACDQLKQKDAAYHQCLSLLATLLAQSMEEPKLCANIAPTLASEKRLCQTLAEVLDKTEFDLSAYIKQDHKNKLLLNRLNEPEADFVNQAKEMGIESSFWSWNAKAADFNNDGWQDIFIVNGYGLGIDKEVHSNLFYQNNHGQNFSAMSEQVGLHDLRNTSSYVYIDYDRDGDLDLITRPVFDQLSVYQNQSQAQARNAKQSLTLQLRDKQGNYFCIGCQVVVEFQDGSKQIQEVKASGGFLSFQPYELHFGLAQAKGIKRLDIRFSDGGQYRINTALEAAKVYRITRH